MSTYCPCDLKAMLNKREVKKGLVTNATVLNKYTNTQKQELYRFRKKYS